MKAGRRGRKNYAEDAKRIPKKLKNSKGITIDFSKFGFSFLLSSFASSA
jgi:hypothetical protein